MKILTGSGWVDAFLEGVICDMEKGSDVVRVEMDLMLVGNDAGARAASAIPRWVVHFSDHLRNDGERMLLEAMRRAKADTLEEQVAEAMMDAPPAGVIMIDSMTEKMPQTVVGTSFQGIRRAFFGSVADRRAKVVGYFVGKKA